jgi:hypothetical protein
MRLRPTSQVWRAYQAHLQHLMQLQLHSQQATHLSHEAVVSRTKHKAACAYLSPLLAAEQYHLHRPQLRDTVSSPPARFLDRCIFSDCSTHA